MRSARWWRFEPPWPPLREGLRSRHGIEVPQEEAKRAMLAEMTYYKAHHHEGTDQPRWTLFAGAARPSFASSFPRPPRSPRTTWSSFSHVVAVSPVSDAAPALGRLRLQGIRSAVVSNWDVSLRGVLAEVGLAVSWTRSSCPPRWAPKPTRPSWRRRCCGCTMSGREGAHGGRLARDGRGRPLGRPGARGAGGPCGHCRRF